MKKTLTLLLSLCFLSINAHAEQYWADNSLSLLYGGNYKMISADEDSEARTMTLEHVSGHSWGGVFLFIDRIQTVDDSYRETYGELSPSFFLKKFDNGFIKSVNAEFTYEFGSSTTDPSSTFSQDNYLAGVGLDFNIPGMDFFKATVYHAWDNNTFGRAEDDQLTLSYGWHYGQVYIDGFLDFTPSKGSQKETELNFTPQITYDFGPMLGLKNKVKVGVEYAYWKNKFGDGLKETQNNVSLLVKWHL